LDFGIWDDLAPLMKDKYLGPLEPQGDIVYEDESCKVLTGRRGTFVVVGESVLWILQLSGVELNSVVYAMSRAKDKRKAFADLAVEYALIKNVAFLGDLKR